ncbi:MAG: hypothetical protein PVI79_00810 [Gammaproteobacteria bacterium]|jgi:hypothetical protein
MSILNLPGSYFAIPDPKRALERCLHRFRHGRTVALGERRVEIRWTERAARELQRRGRPLVIELQLYFSCVVKKRVLFHERAPVDSVPVTDELRLAFRAVTSAACDPLEFANSYPQGEILSAPAAARMVPRHVELDFRRGDWQGEFYY